MSVYYCSFVVKLKLKKYKKETFNVNRVIHFIPSELDFSYFGSRFSSLCMVSPIRTMLFSQEGGGNSFTFGTGVLMSDNLFLRLLNNQKSFFKDPN